MQREREISSDDNGDAAAAIDALISLPLVSFSRSSEKGTRIPHQQRKSKSHLDVLRGQRDNEEGALVRERGRRHDALVLRRSGGKRKEERRTSAFLSLLTARERERARSSRRARDRRRGEARGKEKRAKTDDVDEKRKSEASKELDPLSLGRRPLPTPAKRRRKSSPRRERRSQRSLPRSSSTPPPADGNRKSRWQKEERLVKTQGAV